ncbi:hypothetical protein BJV78DRAFT_491859 [Lactifluus subvellereus]|nr:hypothetical protein BJV78DRAFT_491859 [Lactifluus subvellereus]
MKCFERMLNRPIWSPSLRTRTNCSFLSESRPSRHESGRQLQDRETGHGVPRCRFLTQASASIMGMFPASAASPRDVQWRHRGQLQRKTVHRCRENVRELRRHHHCGFIIMMLDRTTDSGSLGQTNAESEYFSQPLQSGTHSASTFPSPKIFATSPETHSLASDVVRNG